LDNKVDQQELKKEFSKFGPIREFKFMGHMAFVKYDDPFKAKEALEQCKKNLSGQNFTVDFAK
jgi:RNA recognition motif-containing protein